MDKIHKNLELAIRHLQIADHMTYFTYPLIKEKRILLKIIEEIHLSIIEGINSVLEFELKKSYKKPSFENFFKKYSKEYGLTESNLEKIQEIMNLNKKHNESAMEFVKNDKLVILSNNLGIQLVDLSLAKTYLLTAKELILKISNQINKKI